VGLELRRRCTGQNLILEQLEDRIRKVITDVPHDFLQKTVDSIPGRLRMLVDAAGAFVEF